MECECCGKSISFFGTRYGEGDNVFCKDCVGTSKAKRIADKKNLNEDQTSSSNDVYNERIRSILLTTESHSSDLKVRERFGIVTSECVLGMNLFKDVFAGISDVFGGQSKSSQKVLFDLKEKALLELKSRAYELGADAVIAVDLDYNEFSGGGKSMLFLVASGTAIKLENSDIEH